jgi:hypothetical protein
VQNRRSDARQQVETTIAVGFQRRGAVALLQAVTAQCLTRDAFGETLLLSAFGLMPLSG